MPREFPRTRRVGEQIQRELAELIREEVRDPRIGMVTVSGVDVSRDLSHAKVYVTVLGDDQQVRESLRILKRVAGFLRHALGRRMVIRTVPELRFIHDESVERGARLSSLIDQAVADDAARSRHEDDDDSEQ
ncbi:MAG TPA: 30S ribosome-binding factor RbfA [Gammaproteobacteria bacterium]|nr:30S ribosome-binding factor RbfA [Gammaproteobacteria bacterium]